MKKSTKCTKRHGNYDLILKREIARRYLNCEFSYQIAAEEYHLPGRDTVKEFVRWYHRELATVDEYVDQVRLVMHHHNPPPSPLSRTRGLPSWKPNSAPPNNALKPGKP